MAAQRRRQRHDRRPERAPGRAATPAASRRAPRDRSDRRSAAHRAPAGSVPRRRPRRSRARARRGTALRAPTARRLHSGPDAPARRAPQESPARRCEIPRTGSDRRRPASLARRRQAGSSAPWPTTIRSASQSRHRHSSHHALNTVSNAFRRSPSAPTKPTSGRPAGCDNAALAAARSSALTSEKRTGSPP